MCDWFRDKSRDKICAGLRSLGVNARMADRGRSEEAMGEGESLGIIDIDDGPIPWVNVRSVTTSGGGYMDGDDSVTHHHTDYGVPVGYPAPNVTIKRRVTFPLLGKVIDAGWAAEGSDQGSGLVEDVLRRLGEDAQVREDIITTRNVEITGHLTCWVISTATGEVPTFLQAWHIYQAIAQHLIEAGREQPNTE